MRKQWLALLSLAIVAMLVLAACGNGDDDDDDDAADPTNTTAAGGEATTAGGDGDAISVAMLDAMAFEPEELTVSAGEEVDVALSNEGAIEHNFSIDEADVDVTLDGGQSETVTFTAPDEAGEYKIYCNVPGHEEAGMVGTLVVE